MTALLDVLQIKHYFYMAGFLALVAAYVYKPRRTKQNALAHVVLNKNRKMGCWTPEHYKAPIPVAFANWDVNKTKPLPYRAFKDKYSITMGIRSMEWDSWIELDNEWMKFHTAKVERAAKLGRDVYGTSPEAWDAALELLEEFWNYLPNRYPSLFRQLNTGLENLLTGEVFVFRNCAANDIKEDPMLMAGKMVQDDLAVMMEGPDGNYYLKAGAIILPGFWRFKDKYGMSLNEIHESGHVPKYKEKLQTGMTKFFTRLTCDKPVVRNNYFIQTDDNLAWSSSIGQEADQNVGWYTASPAMTAEQCFFRSERQSLRRLPRSGAVVFTIRTYFAAIPEICSEPYIPRRLLNGIESWPDDVRDYRGYDIFKDALLPYLREAAEAQEKNGYVPGSEPNVYPF